MVNPNYPLRIVKVGSELLESKRIDDANELRDTQAGAMNNRRPSLLQVSDLSDHIFGESPRRPPNLYVVNLPN